MTKTLAYPLRLLREKLQRERAMMKANETHMRNATRPHTRAECSCVVWRRGLRRTIPQLERAIELLTEATT